jgi:hypothetical protein
MEITRDESLKLLGLYLLASEHYAKCREAEFALNRALGRDGNDQGHVSDLIYERDVKGSTDDFYRALAREGVTVAEDDLQKSA